MNKSKQKLLKGTITPRVRADADPHGNRAQRREAARQAAQRERRAGQR